MSNRTRTLLFGGAGSVGRTNEGLSASELESLEAGNQAGVEGLRGSAAMMKELARNVDNDVQQQNRTLDNMDKRFENAGTLVSQSMKALQEMVNERVSSRMCTMIFGVAAVLTLFYFIIFRRS